MVSESSYIVFSKTLNYGMQVQLPEVTRAVSVYYAALVLYTLQDCCYVEHEGSTVRT